MKFEGELPSATQAGPARPLRSRTLRTARLVALLTAAATLSVFLPSLWTRNDASYTSVVHPLAADPASEWKDDIWPIREQTPWDISTDFPFPRSLEYTVTEGTWLRLDVHPKSGDIVFDILGDIYCLPGKAYSKSVGTEGLTKARPVLLGIPHDSDPHFSPDGEKLVYRSDAGLGVENIWVKEWTGCEAEDVRPQAAEGVLLQALESQREEEEMLANGVKETDSRRVRRLTREGRLSAHPVTNETYRWLTDARFHPSGTKVVATKWYTSSRSLGAGEGWEYDLPSTKETIAAGSGKRLVGRTLPTGWSAEQYGDQQIGPEQFIWRGNDSVIYAKNVADDSTFSYSKDVHKGIYAIFSTNLTTKRTTTLVDSSPGGASRPELSRDGRTLAFVRRVRDKQALVFKDLVTGSIHNIWYGLTYDASTVSAPMGTYPSFSFSRSDDAVIIWAAGQIWHVPISTNNQGERVAGGTPHPIRFEARIEKRLAETRSSDTDILKLETQEKQEVHAFTELTVFEDGSKVAFQAAGLTYVYDLESERVKEVPVLDKHTSYYSPSFVPHTSDLVLHARWSNSNFTTLELANLTSGAIWEITGLPLGRYYAPFLSLEKGSSRTLGFVKTGGDYHTGDIIATGGAGLYIAHIDLPSLSKSGSKPSTIKVGDVKLVSTSLPQYELPATRLRFLEGNSTILVQQSQRAFTIDLTKSPNELGEYPETTVATGRMSTEIAAIPGKDHATVAVVDSYHVHFATDVKPDDAVWSKPGNSTKGLARFSVDGGHSVNFSPDGKTLFWLLGPYLHWADPHKIAKQCSSEIAKDKLDHGIKCTSKHINYKRIAVDYPTDIARLKKEAAALAEAKGDLAAQAVADFFVIYNATLLTMETGNLQHDVLRDAVLVIRSGVIEAIIGIEDDEAIPYGASVMNAAGGFVVPGFIDSHAHWNGASALYPSSQWELETFLAYGVTTLHNPSTDNVRANWERFRVERGHAVGPRIFHTGDVIYGAGIESVHQDITTLQEAYSALIRIKAEGGPASFSYKNYNLPSRASRQRLLLAARNLSMLCVPEGGMNYDWDQTYIVDGMTTVEHSLPIAQLYDDIIQLFARSGTGSVPTHIVNYGGAWGEQFVWAHEDVPNDPKLRKFIPHAFLEQLTESTARPKNSFALWNTSASTAKMVQHGLKALIGAHGEPPLGLNYHAELFFAQAGGLSNYEAIRAATSDAAQTFGIYSAVGSLTPGKLADLVVYPPEFDLLHGDIRKSRDIQYVVRGGRVWDAKTLTELWPVEGRKTVKPPLSAD
ncbi:hypothetical protein BDW22DRAFT_1370795 [Trametopsis cervina]|nr:hypothetical protein BDW22DRAFT_1370795 [Trametopsis cervina]